MKGERGLTLHTIIYTKQDLLPNSISVTELYRSNLSTTMPVRCDPVAVKYCRIHQHSSISFSAHAVPYFYPFLGINYTIHIKAHMSFSEVQFRAQFRNRIPNSDYPSSSGVSTLSRHTNLTSSYVINVQVLYIIVSDLSS